jgi:hypothetical protein
MKVTQGVSNGVHTLLEHIHKLIPVADTLDHGMLLEY